MSYDSLSEDLFEVLWHHEIQKIDKISLSHFFQKSPFGAIWAQSGTFCLMICSFWIFFKCCSMKVYGRYTMVTVNFAKISLLGQNGQFWPNLGKNYATLFCNVDLDLRIFFFRRFSMIEHNK